MAPAPRTASRRVRTDDGLIAGIIPHAQFTTAMILTINVLLFLATEIGPAGEALKYAGLAHGPSIFRGGDWYRLVTAGFFHGGLIHIGFNSVALYSLGSQIEEIYGSSRFILFYFLATIGGFFASTYFRMGATLGASAGVFGLIGVMIALGMRSRSAMGDHITRSYTTNAIFAIIMSFQPGVDLLAHLGGLATGFGVAYLIGVPGGWREAEHEKYYRWGAYAALALTAISFVRMAGVFQQMLAQG